MHELARAQAGVSDSTANIGNTKNRPGCFGDARKEPRTGVAETANLYLNAAAPPFPMVELRQWRSQIGLKIE